MSFSSSSLYDHDHHGTRSQFQHNYPISHQYSATPALYPPIGQYSVAPALYSSDFPHASVEQASVNSLADAHSNQLLAFDQCFRDDAAIHDATLPSPLGPHEFREMFNTNHSGSPSAFYDSPHASDDGLLEDGRGWEELRLRMWMHSWYAPLSGYEYARDAGYPVDVVTVQQESSGSAGQDCVQAGSYLLDPRGLTNCVLSQGHHHYPGHTAVVPVVPVRTQSPMAHLPYPEDESYHTPSSFSPATQHDRPYLTADYSARPYLSATAAIDAPQSPPLTEDAPKKPLTLACLFCRKRKIACGTPPPGEDRTCNQCARRSLQCEYPVNSRRGTRQREEEAGLS